MLELKPCPFCGDIAVLAECRGYVLNGWRVRCASGCAATMPVWIDAPVSTGNGVDESTRYTSDQAARIAAEKWNRRTIHEGK